MEDLRQWKYFLLCRHCKRATRGRSQRCLNLFDPSWTLQHFVSHSEDVLPALDKRGNAASQANVHNWINRAEEQSSRSLYQVCIARELSTKNAHLDVWWTHVLAPRLLLFMHRTDLADELLQYMVKQGAFKVRSLVPAHLLRETGLVRGNGQHEQTPSSRSVNLRSKKEGLRAGTSSLDRSKVEAPAESFEPERKHNDEEDRLLGLFVKFSRFSVRLTTRMADIDELKSICLAPSEESRAASAIPESPQGRLMTEGSLSSEQGMANGRRGQNVPIWRVDPWKKPWQAKGWSNGFRPDQKPKNTTAASRKIELRDIIASMG